MTPMSPLPRVAAVLLVVGCPADEPSTTMLVGLDPTDAPIAELDPKWRARFTAGDAVFERVYRESQGLGPLYVRTACAACHADDAKGPGFVTKMAATPDAAALLQWGDTARPYTAAGASTPIAPPDDPRVTVSRRMGPAVFGRGYLEAIDDAEILRVEREQAELVGPIRGVANRVAWHAEIASDGRFHDYAAGDTGLIGRFGLKAGVATLDDFAAAAFLGDMSITSPLRPNELPNPDGVTDDMHAGVDIVADDVNLAADYVRLLELPLRPDVDDGDDGAALFEEIGCATCHVPTLHTRADWPIAALADIDAPIYSDLLLHDMGAQLADGVTDGLAGPQQWRTAPLIGLRHLRAYLHDGRAETIEDAILAHGTTDSEAAEVTRAFLELDDDDRDALLAFVEAL